MEPMDQTSTPDLEALIARYDRRVARVSLRGRVLGYLWAYDGSLLELPKRWWRAGSPRQPRLAWLIEWTDPAMSQNGYTDEAGDADADDIAEVISDWDRGRHERAPAPRFVARAGRERLDRGPVWLGVTRAPSRRARLTQEGSSARTEP